MIFPIELEDKKANISKLEEKVNELNAQVQDQQRRYQAASIGMSADEEGSKTLTDKLMGKTYFCDFSVDVFLEIDQINLILLCDFIIKITINLFYF